jgi:hypothetical protein
MVNWARLAEPQEDQYDSQVVLDFAKSRQAYKRRSIRRAPTIFDGAVAVRHIYKSGILDSSCRDAPVTHPNIRKAADYVRKWGVAFAQFATLMDTFHPVISDTWDFDFERDHYVGGSSCGAEPSLFGTMFATVNCPVGLAEAFVHEMAHHKLHALGISLEETTGVIINSADELYVSPIIKDRLRPMSAVFHAEYSYTYVTSLDIVLVREETDPLKLSAFHDQLALNLSRIKEGIEVIKRYIKVDREGANFVDGFVKWNARVIQTAEDLLSCSPAASLH